MVFFKSNFGFFGSPSFATIAHTCYATIQLFNTRFSSGFHNNYYNRSFVGFCRDTSFCVFRSNRFVIVVIVVIVVIAQRLKQ